jgi:hypothetical protein
VVRDRVCYYAYVLLLLETVSVLPVSVRVVVCRRAQCTKHKIHLQPCFNQQKLRFHFCCIVAVSFLLSELYGSAHTFRFVRSVYFVCLSVFMSALVICLSYSCV